MFAIFSVLQSNCETENGTWAPASIKRLTRVIRFFNAIIKVNGVCGAGFLMYLRKCERNACGLKSLLWGANPLALLCAKSDVSSFLKREKKRLLLFYLRFASVVPDLSVESHYPCEYLNIIIIFFKLCFGVTEPPPKGGLATAGKLSWLVD